MSDPAQAIRAYMVGSFTELPPSVVDDVGKGNVSLLGIVRLMGEYLTSEDDQVRTRAVQFLSELVCRLLDPSTAAATPSQTSIPLSDIFTVQGVRTLTTFLADKVSDGVTVADNFIRSANAPEVLPDWAPRAKRNEAEAKTMQGSTMLVSCLRALTVLSTCHSNHPPPAPGGAPHPKGFGSEQAHAVCEALFTNVRAGDHPQSLRFLIYRLLDSLVANHRSSLKTYKPAAYSKSAGTIHGANPAGATPSEATPMEIDEGSDGVPQESRSERCEGKPFLKGYVATVQGEKDPRNLMVLFGVDKVLLTEWEMDREMTEAFFDITFCYFPITFRPPPDDPYGITSDDLKIALRAALSASPAMAPLGYPLLLEKLSAAGGPAKLDTLRTLIAVMPVYGRVAAQANAKKLWEALKIEIFHATDDETCDLSCDALTVLLHVLYDGVDPPEGVAPKMVHDCLVELEEPGKSLANAAIKALACMVRATSSTAYLAVYGFMDQMMKMFADPADLAVRAPILSGVGELLEVLAKVYRASEKQKMREISMQGSSTEAETASTITTATEEVEQKEGSGQMLPSRTLRRTYRADNRPLDPFLADLLSALSNGLRSTSYRRSALLAYSAVISISVLSTASQDGPTNASQDPKPFLSRDETSFLTREVAELVISAKGDDVREEALCAIEVVSSEKVTGGPQGLSQTSKVIEEVVLPVLLAGLPDKLLPGNDSETQTLGQGTNSGLDLNKGDIRRALGAVSRLCVAPHLFAAVVVKIFTKLELCCAPSSRLPATRGTDSGLACEGEVEAGSPIESANIGYARGLILTLQTLVDEKKRLGHRDLVKYGQTLPPRLVRLVLDGIEAGSKSQPLGIAANAQVIADCAGLLGTLAKTLDASKQSDLITVLNKTFCNGAAPHGSTGSGTTLIGPSSLLRDGIYQPFEIVTQSTPFEKAQRDSVSLFSAAVVACGKSVGVPALSASSTGPIAFLSKLIQWTLHTGNSDLQAKSGVWMICSCVNKLIDEVTVEADALISELWSKEVVSGPDFSRRRSAQQIWMWIARGFIVKNNKQGEKMLNLVIDVIFEKVSDSLAGGQDLEKNADWQFAKQAARSFEIVARTDDGVVTKDNGFTIRVSHCYSFYFCLPDSRLG